MARVLIRWPVPNRSNSAMDNSSFSFDAGGRRTQCRFRYQTSPSFPIATENGRFPITASSRWIQPGGSARRAATAGLSSAAGSAPASLVNVPMTDRQRASASTEEPRRARVIARW